MGHRLTSLTFDEWLAFVFEHPVAGQQREWYWELDADWWDGPAALTVEFLTRAFEDAAALFEPYSDGQLNQGLWYLASNACSNHMFALLDEGVPWPRRQRCLRSFSALYAQCFAARCLPALGHLDEQPTSPLNSVCYMWWDILPIAGQQGAPTQPAFDQECLQVMAAALALPHDACQESALHGLGHWASAHPGPVAATVDAYLARSPGLREPLRQYALAARRGMVL